MKQLVLTIAWAIASTMVRAAPSAQSPLVIEVVGIHCDSTNVLPLTNTALVSALAKLVPPWTNTAGALLTIYLPRESQWDADLEWWDGRNLSLTLQNRSVHIFDEKKLVAKSTVVGSAGWTGHDKSKRSGLILAFNSIGDAKRVADAIGVRGILEHNAKPSERPGDYWLPDEFDIFRDNGNRVREFKG